MNKIDVLSTFTIGLSDSLQSICTKYTDFDKSCVIMNLLDSHPELNDNDSSTIVFLKRRKIKYNNKCVAQRISVSSYNDNDDNDYEIRFGSYIDLTQVFCEFI